MEIIMHTGNRIVNPIKDMVISKLLFPNLLYIILAFSRVKYCIHEFGIKILRYITYKIDELDRL